MAIGLSMRWFLLLASVTVCCKCFFFGCPPCELVDCPEPQCNDTLQILEPECGCCTTCAKADAEPCGGSTNDQCAPGSSCTYRLGLIMGEERTGICEPAVCKRAQCGYRRYCGLSVYGEEHYLCRCRDHHCEGKDNKVCGYDGVTYNSICSLRHHECSYQNFIGIRHMGPCVPTPAPPTQDPYYVKTNTVPVYVDDLFDQVVDPLPEIDNPVDHACIYKGYEYARYTRTKLDACTYLFCEADGSAVLVKVPGCPGGPVELDYGISLPPVHGGWTEWKETECVGTCHSANKTLQRFCTNPSPQNEGSNCSGPSEMVVKCVPDTCNYTCDYTEWSEWEPCSVTCGNGTHQRRRKSVHNITELEANNCDLVETRTCHIVETCPTSCQRVTLGEKKILDTNGCETVSPFPIFECVGPCSGEEEECCGVARMKHDRRTVNCPGEVFNRESRFDYIHKCSCNKQHCPLTES